MVVGQAGQLAGFQSFPQLPVILGFEVGIAACINRRLGHVYEIDMKALVLEVLREVVTDANRIDVH